ncbi:MAG: hypothetical protein ACREOF_13570 [Gemmatimonadales bacterium]
MEPGSVDNGVTLARVYLKLERHAEASALLEGSIDRAGRVPILLAYLGQTYAASSRRNEALGLLAELRAAAELGYIPPAYYALILIQLGELDEGFRLWELAYEQRSGWLPFLRSEPLWDPLRSDSRFLALLKGMRLDP